MRLGHRPRRRLERIGTVLMGIAVVSALAVIVVAHEADRSKTSRPATTTGMHAVGGQQARASSAGVHMDMDHATFTNVNDLAGQSSVVLIGTVESSSPGLATPVGSDPSTGQPLPPLPHTDFVVRVVRSLKGSVAAGAHITVTLAGGMTDVGPVTVDGVPDLPAGQTFEFFLGAASGKKYYPLAGGAAVAASVAGGRFKLSSEVTGGATIEVDPSTSFAPADTAHLVVTNHPTLNLLGPVQSGELLVSSSNVTGNALIQGHAFAPDITIAGSKVTGTFTVDGQQFTITSGRSVNSTPTAAHLEGTVRTGAGASPQYTAIFALGVINR
jgi:hypothetical protein